MGYRTDRKLIKQHSAIAAIFNQVHRFGRVFLKSSNYQEGYKTGFKFGMETINGKLCDRLPPVHLTGQTLEDWQDGYRDGLKRRWALLAGYDARQSGTVQEYVPMFRGPCSFALKDQGLIPIVGSMLAEGKSWVEIGESIGWPPQKAKRQWLWAMERIQIENGRRNEEIGESNIDSGGGVGNQPRRLFVYGR